MELKPYEGACFGFRFFFLKKEGLGIAHLRNCSEF